MTEKQMNYVIKIRNNKLKNERISYPYSIPSILNLEELELKKRVTFIIGENGSGKSTLIEALAIKAGFSPEGGSLNLNFRTHDSHSELYNDIGLTRSHIRNTDGFFLRAESFYNVATEIDNVLSIDSIEKNYGGSLHGCSHGESFIALVLKRFRGNGLYILDEPESALSINNQFKLMVLIKNLVDKNSQFVIATHSPVLMAYPGSDIYQISEDGIHLINYEETEQYRLTKYFLNNYKQINSELGLY